MVFGGSSRNRNRINPDGTHAVQCWSCRQFICMTAQPLTRALCLLCQAAEEGRELPAETLRQYEQSRGEASDVSMLLLEPEAPLKKKGRARFSDNLSESWGAALNFLRQRKPEEGPARTLAATKRRGTLLQGLELGSMEQVDAALKKEGV